jgi:hypothetical protein
VNLVQRQTRRRDFFRSICFSFFAVLIGSVHIPCSLWVCVMGVQCSVKIPWGDSIAESRTV